MSTWAPSLARCCFLSELIKEKQGKPVTLGTLARCAFNGSLGETIKQVALLTLFTICLAPITGTLGNSPAPIMSQFLWWTAADWIKFDAEFLGVSQNLAATSLPLLFANFRIEP